MGGGEPSATGASAQNIPRTTAHIRRDVNMTVDGCMLRPFQTGVVVSDVRQLGQLAAVRVGAMSWGVASLVMSGSNDCSGTEQEGRERRRGYEYRWRRSFS